MELKLISSTESDFVYYGCVIHHDTVNKYTIGDYAIKEITMVYSDGTIDYRLIINTNNGDYTPEIYVIYKDGTTKIKEFKIATTSYGSLSLDGYKEFLKEQIDAMKVIEILTEKFIKNT